MEEHDHEGKKYVLATDLAREKGVSRVAIYNAISEERLPALNVFGRVLIPVEAANAWEVSRGGRRSGAGRPKGKPTT